MASLTVSLPDDLASQIRAQEKELPRILALGLRELNAGAQSGFDGAADVLEFLAALPAPEEILQLRPSPRLAVRVAELVEKSRAFEMSPDDEEDWEKYEYLEHLVRMAKAAARLKLASSSHDG
jgi:Na+-transporting NADH:ubiquinone oxidoreductase subunit NqrF